MTKKERKTRSREKLYSVEGLSSLFVLCSLPSRVLFALKSKQVCFETKMSDRQTGGEEEEEEGCCLFEGLISFGKEGDGIRDVLVRSIRLTEPNLYDMKF